MYRDERSAIRARLEAARGRRDDALRATRERIDAIVALNEQLEKKGQRGAAPSAPETGVAVPDDLDALSLGDELRLCDALEQDAVRLAAEGERLSTTVKLLNDRVLGRKVVEPLGPPPRRVPASYVIAELVTWYGIYALAELAVGARAKEVGPIAIGLILMCLVGTVFRPWDLEFRFLPLLIAHVTVGFGALGAGAWLAKTWLVRAHPLASLVLAAAAVLAADVWHALRRRAFLARCKVATAQLVESALGSSSYSSWPLPYGRGWDSGVEAYDGSAHVSVVAYTTDEGYEGRLEAKGPPWEDAVVLYDPDHPERALPVQAFGCGPRPTFEGNWSGGLGGWRAWRVIVGVVALLGAVASLLR